MTLRPHFLLARAPSATTSRWPNVECAGHTVRGLVDHVECSGEESSEGVRSRGNADNGVRLVLGLWFRLVCHRHLAMRVYLLPEVYIRSGDGASGYRLLDPGVLH